MPREPIFVSYRRDLYSFYFNHDGEVSEIYIQPDNMNRKREPLSWEDVEEDEELMSRFHTKVLEQRRAVDHHVPEIEGI